MGRGTCVDLNAWLCVVGNKRCGGRYALCALDLDAIKISETWGYDILTDVAVHI